MAALLDGALTEVWRRVIVGEGKAWAVFAGGTCVIFGARRAGVADAARDLLREWGPVYAGTPAGDFSVITLVDHPGWVVTCHHPDVLSYVAPGDVSGASEVTVGLHGRSLRASDAEQLNVVHVEGESPGDPLYFYSKTQAYHELSNFAPLGFEADGAYWSTVEHYFQAQKFPGAEHAAYRERIRRAATPKEAKALGRTRAVPLRPDWDDARDAVMLTALRRKFEREPLRGLLLGTELRWLVEASPSDHYWGAGRSGSGRNRLGQLLMQVRAELRGALTRGSADATSSSDSPS